MEMRAVHARRKGNWVRIEGLNYLRRGEVFRMFEPSGEEVVDKNGNKVFYAISEPYWSNEVQTWLVDVTPKPLFH
jgi:hypothetical protein